MNIKSTAIASMLLATSATYAGLVAHYPLNEASGTAVFDSSGNGLHGTIAGGAIGTEGAITSVAGISGNALQFSDDSHLITISSTAWGEGENLKVANGFTISTWLNWTASDRNRGAALTFTQEGSGNRSVDLGVGGGVNAHGSVYARVRRGNSINDTNPNTASNPPNGGFNTGDWQHVVGVFTSTGISVFVNGELVDNWSGNTLTNNSLNLLTIGAYRADSDSSTTSHFIGAIDDIQIYNVALTTSEIEFLRDNPGTAHSVLPPRVATVSHGPWSGAITPHTARVHVKMSEPASGARLLVDTDENFNNPRRIDPAPSHDNLHIASFTLDALTPNQLYHYTVELSDDTLDLERRGRLHTFPAGTASFSFAFAACANTGSNHRVFDHIAAADPLFYLNIGDFHYRDIAVNNPDLFRDAFDSVFGSARQSALYRAVPLAYIWDDHDYGPNDSDRLSPGRPAALQVYREYIPHYPLAFAEPEAPIDQSFVVGRARFILSDLRSQRDPKNATDNENKRMMSEQQLEWLKTEMLDAKAAGQAIFWVSTVPWIEPATAGSDMWGGYSFQRREIANFLAENQVTNLVIVAGDAHMLAADDGSNANFSDYPNAPTIRVLQAAALDRDGSVKGGPYSEGTFPGGGQYGHVTVTDQGDDLRVRFSGRAVHPTTGDMTERVSLEFTLPLGAPHPPPRPSLRNINLTPSGAFNFEFDGGLGRAYRIEVSPDLHKWSPLGVPAQNESGRFEFSDPTADQQPRRFYRILVE